MSHRAAFANSPRGNGMDDRTNFFVGWGTLSLINAGLAQSKGRSGLVWCLISLLLGPIATFLIVVLAGVAREDE
jgi:hypothetical protein